LKYINSDNKNDKSWYSWDMPIWDHDFNLKLDVAQIMTLNWNLNAAYNM
jgi:hypothetical protein